MLANISDSTNQTTKSLVNQGNFTSLIHVYVINSDTIFSSPKYLNERRWLNKLMWFEKERNFVKWFCFLCLINKTKESYQRFKNLTTPTWQSIPYLRASLGDIAQPDFFRTEIVKVTTILVFYNKILLLVSSFPISQWHGTQGDHYVFGCATFFSSSHSLLRGKFLRIKINCCCNSKNTCSWYTPLKN